MIRFSASVAGFGAALAALPNTGLWDNLRAQAQAERQRMIDALLAGDQVTFATWLDEAAALGAVADRPPLSPRTHQRAGITKCKHRGQPKARRRMAAASRRRNRRKRV
jgi:hypothetical protein